jgi:hypothetical protein
MLNILKIGGGNEAFYILKAFCACWVVFLHLPGISKESLLFLPFLRIAVPCFFMISGYYLVSNNDLDRDKVIIQLKKVVHLVLFYNGLFLLWKMFSNYLLLLPIVDEKWGLMEFWLEWLLKGDNICYPFWYLTAYFQVLIILWIVSKLKILRYIYILIPILLVLSVLLNRYSFILTDQVLDTAISRSALFCAFPSVLMGIYIKIQVKINVLKNIKSFFFLISVFAYLELLLLSLYDVNGSGADYNMMTYPLAIVSILLCIKFPIPNVSKRLKNPLIIIGQKFATNIYLFHILVFSILEVAFLLGVKSLAFQNAESVILIIILVSIGYFLLQDLFRNIIVRFIKYDEQE